MTDINEKYKEYIEAAIPLIPDPSPQAHYMLGGKELIDSSNAFRNPTGLTDAVDVIKEMGDAVGGMGEVTIVDGDSDSTLNSIIKAAMLGGMAGMGTSMNSLADSATEMTDKMFTDLNPFSEKMSVGAGSVGMGGGLGRSAGFTNRTANQRLTPNTGLSTPSVNAQMMGVPSFSATIGLPSSAQSSKAQVGLDQDNPCSSIFSTIGELTTTVSDMVGDVVDKINENISDVMGFVNDVINDANQAVNAIVDKVSAVVGEIVDWTTEGINKVMDKVNDVLGTMQDAVDDAIGGVMEVISDVASNVAEVYNQVVDSINDMVSNIVEQAHLGITNLVRGMTEGNPCMQALMLGDNGIATPDMQTLIKDSIDPKKLVGL